MIFLYKIWIFNIDFNTVLSFIFGIVIGMIMLCLIYAVLVVLSLRDKKYAIQVQANDLKAVEAERMIEIARRTFTSKDLRGNDSKVTHFSNVSKDLVYGIASRFYPDSKYPLFELTVDECVELIGYIQTRLDEILDKKILKLVKKLKVSDIMNLKKATTSVVDSKAFEVTKDVGKAISIGKKIINVINPFWWTKKLIADVGIEIIMKQLYLAVISIIGEEAYKIYSKSYKNSAEDIDSNIDDLVNSIDEDIKKELVKENPNTSFGETKNTTVEKKMKKRVWVKESNPQMEYATIYESSQPMKKKEAIPCELVAIETSLVVREDLYEKEEN